MKKRLCPVLAAMLAAALFAACGSTPPAAPSDSSAAPAESSSASSAPPAASGDRTLIVYSPQADTDRGQWMVDRAKKDANLDVQFLSGTGGEISDRLRAEKQNPQADVVMGLVQTSMYQLKAEDILTPYTPKWTEGLPEVYKDKDSMFHSFWQTPIVLAYNPDFLKAEQAPKNWLDLAKPEVKGLYNIGGTGAQTTRAYLIGILWNFYDPAVGDVTQEGWDYLKAFYENSRAEPVSDASDTWKLMKNGDAPLILSWYGGIKSNCAKNEIPVEFVSPAEGTPVVAEAIGIVKGTKKEDLAKEFIDWFGSAQVMADYAGEFNQAPVHPDAIALCSDEIKADATRFVAQDIDWEIASQKLDSWLEKIELEIMQ